MTIERDPYYALFMSWEDVKRGELTPETVERIEFALKWIFDMQNKMVVR